ncbi:MAG: rod shape-determining protein MreD [Sphingomonadaceae bacterium]|nr:rod shape-determining protein MreD [Sphingomonadaceae bacterium]
MALVRRHTRFDPPPSALERQLVPVVSVMLASLAPLLPFVATEPLLPPFGFMTLLAWRLLRVDLWPVWAALPLGAFDDLFSGQPIGSAMAIWTVALLVLEAVDGRLVWRDHWQNWAIAACAIALELLFALGLAMVGGGATAPWFLLPQFVLSILLFPVVARICASLDRRRFAR